MNWTWRFPRATVTGMDLSGIFVPLVTPFDADGAVDVVALKELGESVLAAGAAGIVALGTTGEPANLAEDERAAVVETVQALCHRVDKPLLVGVGGSSTAGTVQAVEALARRSATVATQPWTAAMVVVPPYTRPGEAGVVAHFRAVAEASALPVVVYHVPYRTGQALSTGALLEIAGLPNVAGMKLSDGPITGETVALLAQAPPEFAILGGDDAVISPLLGLGAAGGILASAHVATEEFVALHQAWQVGDVSTARKLGARLSALSGTLFAEPNPAVTKAVLHAQGRIATPHVRLPLLPASNTARDAALIQLTL